jgi:uncharacterized membrane protein YkgB
MFSLLLGLPAIVASLVLLVFLLLLAFVHAVAGVLAVSAALVVASFLLLTCQLLLTPCCSPQMARSLPHSASYQTHKIVKP